MFLAYNAGSQKAMKVSFMGAKVELLVSSFAREPHGKAVIKSVCGSWSQVLRLESGVSTF